MTKVLLHGTALAAALEAKQCMVAGCSRQLYARGFCKTCFVILFRQGVLEEMALPSRNGSFEDRLLKGYTVDVRSGCWLWLGKPRPRDGYGSIGLPRVPGKSARKALAHKAMYEWLVGPVPAGLVLDHLCRNRMCVNPKHLEPVTDAVNILRGEGVSAQNARKTHCKHNHPLSGDNLYIRPDILTRVCKTCARQRKHGR